MNDLVYTSQFVVLFTSNWNLKHALHLAKIIWHCISQSYFYSLIKLMLQLQAVDFSGTDEYRDLKNCLDKVQNQ